MKDARFIELVNLYIDRQISPEEAAELEAELQSNPRRRQVYQQYCHMHRATKLVYESFRTHADQGAETPTGSSTIARFESRKRAMQRTRWSYAMGGLAAAACVAFVLMRSGTFQKSDAEALTTVSSPKMQTAAIVQPKSETTTVAPAATRTEVAKAQPDYAAMIAALHQEEQPQAFAIKPLFDDGVFENRQAPADSKRLFQNKPRQDNRQSAEFTAFQFQR